MWHVLHVHGVSIMTTLIFLLCCPTIIVSDVVETVNLPHISDPTNVNYGPLVMETLISQSKDVEQSENRQDTFENPPWYPEEDDGMDVSDIEYKTTVQLFTDGKLLDPTSLYLSWTTDEDYKQVYMQMSLNSLIPKWFFVGFVENVSRRQCISVALVYLGPSTIISICAMLLSEFVIAKGMIDAMCWKNWVPNKHV